jgi:hypothetical protein
MISWSACHSLTTSIGPSEDHYWSGRWVLRIKLLPSRTPLEGFLPSRTQGTYVEKYYYGVMDLVSNGQVLGNKCSTEIILSLGFRCPWTKQFWQNAVSSQCVWFHEVYDGTILSDVLDGRMSMDSWPRWNSCSAILLQFGIGFCLSYVVYMPVPAEDESLRSPHNQQNALPSKYTNPDGNDNDDDNLHPSRKKRTSRHSAIGL